MVSSCPIMSKIFEQDIFYDQHDFYDGEDKIIVTTHLNNNKRCVVYISGYDDYFYHHNVVEYYPYIDFISIDVPGFGYNKGYSHDNNILNINKMCGNISSVLNDQRYNLKDKDVDIIGFSMGGHIAMCYVWLSERSEDMFKFRKLLLMNPLFDFKTESQILTKIAVFLSRLTYFFTNSLNIIPESLEYNHSDFLELENIYNSEKLRYYNVDNFDTSKLSVEHKKPFYNGTLVKVLKNISIMIESENIQTETICILSKKYGDEPLLEDNICDPEDSLLFLPKICNDIRIKQFECGHQPFRQPFFTKVNFIDLCDYIFEI